MLIGVTGATGFIGTYICRHLVDAGHGVKVLARPQSDLSYVNMLGEVILGDISDAASLQRFLKNCTCVVHAALARTDTEMANFETNLLGSLRLFELCRQAGAQFLFISTGAVHDIVLDDRRLDEAHPLWPSTTYGAQKAAVEAFLPAYREQYGANGSAYRPTGVYGLNVLHPERSHWYDLVRRVVSGGRVETSSGGKVVHVEDVAAVIARAVCRRDVAGQSYELTDCHIHDQVVAEFAREISGSGAQITDTSPPGPRHEIVCDKARKAFGVELARGHEGVRLYVEELVDVLRDAV